ncbi:MAG: IS200/IS605 family transposase [Saprospiraceae bacterium]
MCAYTKFIYQIIFTPKYRTSCMIKNNRDELFKYIAGILKNKNCHLYQINGVEDHVHILTHVHPSIALADLIKDVKINSNKFIKEQNLFPEFTGWQDGYNAFTYSNNALPNLIRYVQNQEEHHKKASYIKEIKALLKEHDIDFEEKFL